jgi:hypothetical protein
MAMVLALNMGMALAKNNPPPENRREGQAKIVLTF